MAIVLGGVAGVAALHVSSQAFAKRLEAIPHTAFLLLLTHVVAALRSDTVAHPDRARLAPFAAALVGMWALARSVLDAWQADLAAIAFLGPIAALVAIAGCVWMRSDTREDFARVTARFRRNGRAAT